MDSRSDDGLQANHESTMTAMTDLLLPLDEPWGLPELSDEQKVQELKREQLRRNMEMFPKLPVAEQFTAHYTTPMVNIHVPQNDSHGKILRVDLLEQHEYALRMWKHIAINLSLLSKHDITELVGGSKLLSIRDFDPNMNRERDLNDDSYYSMVHDI
jgi:hypothetical protein